MVSVDARRTGEKQSQKPHTQTRRGGAPKFVLGFVVRATRLVLVRWPLVTVICRLSDRGLAGARLVLVLLVSVLRRAVGSRPGLFLSGAGRAV